MNEDKIIGYCGCKYCAKYSTLQPIYGNGSSDSLEKFQKEYPHPVYATEQEALANFGTSTGTYKFAYNMSSTLAPSSPVFFSLDETRLPGEPVIYEPKTQKAKGIAVLKKNYFNVPGFKIYTLDAAKAEPSKLLSRFVRPCPMRPRHGFVDSRLINTVDELLSLIEETRIADPDAELVAMQLIRANYSGIWTPGLLTIGQGNSGATSGTSAKTLPVIGDLLNTNRNQPNVKNLLKQAGVKHAPYVELLWAEDGEKPYFVQLRDGPELPQTVDYITSEYKVERIVLATGDLLDWEKKMENTEPGTVVYHPGGSLASHYAIHAVLHKIPVLISREPKVGEILRPTQEESPAPSLSVIRAGFMYGMRTKLSHSEAVYVMLAGLHHITAWQGKFDFLLGMAMGCAYRLTVTAALGEARHAPRADGLERKRKLNRDTVYDRAWDKTHLPAMVKKFRRGMETFITRDWGGNSFGGKPWYIFSSFGVALYNAIVGGNVQRAFSIFNKLVNSAHNGGWAFNKFINNRELDIAAANPVYAAFRSADKLYEAMNVPTSKYAMLSKSFTKYRREIPEFTNFSKFKERLPIRILARLEYNEDVIYLEEHFPSSYGPSEKSTVELRNIAAMGVDKKLLRETYLSLPKFTSTRQKWLQNVWVECTFHPETGIWTLGADTGIIVFQPIDIAVKI